MELKSRNTMTFEADIGHVINTIEDVNIIFRFGVVKTNVGRQ